MMLPNRSPILKRSIINSGRALPFSPSYNPAIITSLWQNTAKTTAVTIADPVRVQSDLNGNGQYGLLLPGVAGNYASTPDAAALGIAENVSILDYVASNDWTPASRGATVHKGNGYTARIDVNGTRAFNLKNADGGAFITINSTATVPVSDGHGLYTLTTYQANDGSGNRVTKFYTSLDGVTWTQLGNTITTASPANIAVETTPLSVGATNAGTADFFAGRVFQAQVWNGLLTVDGNGALVTSGATKVFDANFAAQATGATTFAESANGATVTINGTGSFPAYIGRQYDAIAPSDAARPLYARSPKSGIRNLLLSTENFNGAAWTIFTSGDGAYEISPDGNSITFTVTSSGRAFINNVFVYTTGVNYTLSVSQTVNSGTYAGNTLTVSGNSAAIATTGRISHTSSGSATTTLRFGIVDTASAPISVTYTLPQLEAAASASAYQRVGTTRADITESGVDSAFSLLFDGTDDYLDTGVQSFGSASLFADAGQNWAVCGWSQVSVSGTKSVIGKCSINGASQTFYLVYTDNGKLNLRARGEITVIDDAEIIGTYHAFVINWDGTTLNAYVNSLTPTAVTVGAASEEAQNILVGARTASSPANFMRGRIGNIALIDRSLTTAEIASVMRYLASESGAVIS